VFSARDMLRYAAVPGLDRAYVIGCLERRVTIYAQQVRALNTVNALFTTGRVQPGDTVVVLGAGFAGLTAAVGAAFLGAEVIVLEKEPIPFSVQAGCSQRWIHPHIYDWPYANSDQASAELPVLDWQAGPCESVVRDLRAEVERAQRDYRLEINCSIEDLQLPGEGNLRYQAHDDVGGLRSPYRRIRYSALIVAVGFGVEPDGSYWREDDLEQPFPGPRNGFVVSGIGDGGLIESVRLRLGGHGEQQNLFPWLMEEFLPSLNRYLIGELRAAESAAEPSPSTYAGDERHRRDEGFSHELAEVYERLLGEHPEVLRAAGSRLRPDSQVRLVGTLPEPYHPHASALNRFLVAVLRHVDGPHFEYIQGRTAASAGGRVIRRTGTADAGTVDPIEDDTRLIVRHGPTSALEAGLAGLAEKLRGVSPMQLDAPRIPQWDSSLFEGYGSG